MVEEALQALVGVMKHYLLVLPVLLCVYGVCVWCDVCGVICVVCACMVYFRVCGVCVVGVRGCVWCDVCGMCL